MKSKDENGLYSGAIFCILSSSVRLRRSRPTFSEKLCLQEVVFPNGKRKRPTISTLRRKLNRYRKDGFQSLARKARSDRGASRRFSREIIDKAVELKRTTTPQRRLPQPLS
ncbi:MAG: hypothetical protein HS127_07805 [Planctomycetia bacterium]|nr:hypothetical protein [Planctomycetia bacterium]